MLIVAGEWTGATLNSEVSFYFHFCPPYFLIDQLNWFLYLSFVLQEKKWWEYCLGFGLLWWGIAMERNWPHAHLPQRLKGDKARWGLLCHRWRGRGYKQARKPRSYTSSKLRLTNWHGVKCRATSVPKKELVGILRRLWWRHTLSKRLCPSLGSSGRDLDPRRTPCWTQVLNFDGGKSVPPRYWHAITTVQLKDVCPENPQSMQSWSPSELLICILATLN